MKILVACEESQAVCKAFRAKGHEAYSCDLIPCSGGHPEWHLQIDVKYLVHQPIWDMIIAFPPCTNLCSSGAAWFKKKREDGTQQASIDFFKMFTNLECEKVAIENPIGIMSTQYRKPDQIIQTYMFGDPHRKATCLWLKGLPKLEPTNIVEPTLVQYTYKNGKVTTYDIDQVKGWNGERAKYRSKTYLGIAQAMADQWG